MPRCCERGDPDPQLAENGIKKTQKEKKPTTGLIRKGITVRETTDTHTHTHTSHMRMHVRTSASAGREVTSHHTIG